MNSDPEDFIEEEEKEKLENLLEKVNDGELEEEYIMYFVFHYLGKSGAEFFDSIEMLKETFTERV